MNGFIYMLWDCSGYVKIGWSMNPDKRRQEIQIGNPRRLRELARKSAERKCERDIHRQFKESRALGEWFSVNRSVVEFAMNCDVVNLQCLEEAKSFVGGCERLLELAFPGRSWH